jgi:hypothetical protein
MVIIVQNNSSILCQCVNCGDYLVSKVLGIWLFRLQYFRMPGPNPTSWKYLIWIQHGLLSTLMVIAVGVQFVQTPDTLLFVWVRRSDCLGSRELCIWDFRLQNASSLNPTYWKYLMYIQCRLGNMLLVILVQFIEITNT